VPIYYVNTNAQANGDHEVHESGCTFMPDASNRKFLGDFQSCHAAVRESKRYYSKSNGCFYCSLACHTT
jgi:hypothetical protein